MAAQGNKNSGTVTLVTGGLTPVSLLTDDLNLFITVPEDNPYRSRTGTIGFGWVDADGLAVEVDGFGLGDIGFVGEGLLENFRKTDTGYYEVTFNFLNNRIGLFIVTVQGNVAQLESDSTVTGPPNGVMGSIYYDTTGIPATVRITPSSDRNSTQIGLLFEWVTINNVPISVTDFELDDIETTLGTISDLESLGSASIYTANLNVAVDTNQDVTITVPLGVVIAEGLIPAPFEDVSETFSVDNRVLGLDITGADSVCIIDRDINANEFLNDALSYYIGMNAGGAFNGVLESVDIGDFHYSVVQIEKHLQTVDGDGNLTGEPFIDNNLQAGAVLLRTDLSDCSHTIIKAYKDITTAATYLTVIGNDLYFIEGSHYMYHDDVNFHSASVKNQLSNVWKSGVGRVYKLESSMNEPELLGVNWRSATTEDNPDDETTDYFYGIHGAASSPMFFIGDILNIITGYGDFENIRRYDLPDEPENKVDNWQWIQRDVNLNRRIPELLTNDRTGFQVLRDIAIATNSILGFELDQFFIKPRYYRSAKVAATLPSGELAPHSDIVARFPNWITYPTSGNMLIGDELISYTGISGESRTGIKRAISGTVQSQHDPDDEIIFVDHIISINQNSVTVPINELDLYNDYRQLYNQISLSYGDDKKVFVEDQDSITNHGEKLFEMSAPIDSHQKVWAEWIANAFLERFKEVRQILDLTLKPSPYIEIGDIIYLIVPRRLHLQRACQVIEVNHMLQNKVTEVKLVTVN